MFFETAFGEVPFSLGMLSTVFSYNGTVLGISAFLEMFWKQLLQKIPNFLEECPSRFLKNSVILIKFFLVISYIDS